MISAMINCEERNEPRNTLKKITGKKRRETYEHKTVAGKGTEVWRNA